MDVLYILFITILTIIKETVSNDAIVKCYDGNKTADNCYACFYTKIKNEANPYHCEKTMASARQLTLFISTISPFDLLFNQQFLIECDEENNRFSEFKVCACQSDFCNQDYETCCDTYKTTIIDGIIATISTKIRTPRPAIETYSSRSSSTTTMIANQTRSIKKTTKTKRPLFSSTKKETSKDDHLRYTGKFIQRFLSYMFKLMLITKYYLKALVEYLLE